MRTLRVLAILTKRQMTDNGAYLIAALLVPAGLVLATMILAFFTNYLYLPVPTIYLLVALFVLLWVASYLFGVKQVRADQESGISRMLSSLPVSGGQILLARVATALLFLLVVLVFMTLVVAGAVLFDLLPGGKWVELRASAWSWAFLMDMLVYTLGSASLIALTCHSFGLRRARTAPTLVTALGGLPLIPVFILLVIIKGFTLLSTVLFSLLLLGLWISLVARPGHRVPSLAAPALIACILISVPLFCSRYLCDLVLSVYAADSGQRVEIKPSGLFSWEMESKRPSVASGRIEEEYSLNVSSYRPIRVPRLLSMLGIVDSVGPWMRTPLDIYNSSGAYWQSVYFDDTLGQMVGTSWEHPVYAGPEGIASVFDGNLGRFVSPVFGNGVLYDRRSRRFYAIEAEEETVRRGEALKDRSRDPIDILPHPYGSRMCSVNLDVGPAAYDMYYRDYVPVLDRSGRIALLDRRTLDIRGWVGRLPRPRTLFGRGSGQPGDLLDWDVDVIASRRDGEYVGMIAGSLSRQGTSLTLTVFDEEGKEIRTAHSYMDMFESTLTVGRYLMESLHPPIFALASFFTTCSFEAGATHRALFLMPNSFVALQRDRETGFISQFFLALLFLLPALLFAGFLTWRVLRDATIMGLPRRVRWLWGVGTLAFGLPAYITYRLTRPRAALALCRDCGRGRRVDQEVCHHCGNGWNAPVLEPPTWGVTSP